jgi:hypothetical protein
MSARPAAKRAAISMWLLTFLIGVTAPGSAAPIELDNDVSVNLQNAPCFFNPDVRPQLCNFVDGQWVQKPGNELVRFVGAPRMVPDASNAGNLLDISVDFVGVSLQPPVVGLPGFPDTPLILNVYDLHQKPIPGPDGSVPLQLKYFIPPTPFGSGEASDVFLSLGDFDDFDLLPAGDLIFTVGFHPIFFTTDNSPDRPDHVTVITLSGVGSTEVPVPEPSTLLLLLSGVAITGLRARRRRPGSHRHLLG